MLKRPAVIVSFGVLALLAGYVLAFPPQKIAGTHLAECPMSLGGLPGTALSLDQTVLDDLDPDDYLIRRYDRPDGAPVWLVIVYFQNARLGAHDPQLCYRSQGFGVDPGAPGRLETPKGAIPYQSFRAVKGTRDELVRCFWYTAGGQTLNEVKGWRDRMFLQGLRSNRSFGAFVRVSTLESGDAEVAGQALDKVMRDLAPLLPRFFPEGRNPREVNG